ncbi:hypothetical protein [Vitreimonas sp.]|uniref:hypothetical protein n=1 Tax=Vitreimonas sp. TaxID=3069702 RepID=UPI002EDB72B4
MRWGFIFAVALAGCAPHDEGRKLVSLQAEIFPDGQPADTRTDLLRILDWTARNADMSDAPEFDQLTVSMLRERSALEMYAHAYRPNVAGGYCSVTAVFSAMVFREFGFDALNIDFGAVEGSMTHVTTVVFNPFGQRQFYILDPTFNFHVERPDATWAPLNEILARAPVRIVERPTMRDQLWPLGRPVPAAYGNCEPGPGLLVCTHPNDSLERFMSTHARELDALGLDPTPSALFDLLRLRVYSITGGSAEARAALQELLAAHDVPLGPS